ncbi:MAG TPA: hypothetical protein VF549_07055 [Solirubrobacteraceae bacterium]
MDAESRLFLLFRDLWEWLDQHGAGREAEMVGLPPILDEIAAHALEDPVTRLMANSLPDAGESPPSLVRALPPGVARLLEAERAARGRDPCPPTPAGAAELHYDNVVAALAREIPEFREESAWLQDEADWKLVSLVFDEFDSWLTERALAGDVATAHRGLAFIEQVAEAATTEDRLAQLLLGSVFCYGQTDPAIVRQLGPRSRSLYEQARAEADG